MLLGKIRSQGQSLVSAEEGANPLWGCGEDGDPSGSSTGLSISLDGCQGVFQLQAVTAHQTLAMHLLELNVTTLLSPVQEGQRTKSPGSCSTPPWPGISWLLLRLPGWMWGLGTPQGAVLAPGLSNACPRTGSRALTALPWGTHGGITHKRGENLTFPPSLGPCSLTAIHLQPVTIPAHPGGSLSP